MHIDDKTEKRLQPIVKKLSSHDSTWMIDYDKLSKDDRVKLNHMVTISLLYTQSAKFRGKAIDISIFFETALSMFLASYFCSDKDKRSRLNSYVFDRMPLTTKFNLLKKLLKLNHQELWNEHRAALKRCSKLIEFRNDIAHSMLDSSSEYATKLREEYSKGPEHSRTQKADKIQISYFENNDLKTKEITRTQIDKFYKDMYKQIELLQNIQSALKL